MMPHQRVFALVITTSISALAYPAFYSTSDNLLENQEVAAIDTRTTTDIYQEYFGSAENAETPAISDELSDRLQSGAWYNTPATDQGNSWLTVLDQARSIKPKAVKRSSTRKSKSSSYLRGSKANSQLKRYRNQTMLERTRNRTVTAAASRIKQSNRKRQLNTIKKKRQRERSRGYLLSTQRRSKLDRTRRFRHTRTGTTPGY